MHNTWRSPVITNPVAKNKWTEYLIPKGEHYSQSAAIQITNVNKLEFTAVFDSSCRYNTIKKDNQLDLNKLYGFSDCGTDHHENSARFAWRWNGEKIEIHAYCYVNGKRMSQYLGALNVNIASKFYCGQCHRISIPFRKNACPLPGLQFRYCKRISLIPLLRWRRNGSTRYENLD